MAVSLGTLLLELQLDSAKFHQDLEAARRSAMKAGADIERSLQESSRFKTPKLDVLVPRVDDRELTALNQHLSLKEKHWGQVHATFSKAVKPKIDTRELDKPLKPITQEVVYDARMQRYRDTQGRFTRAPVSTQVQQSQVITQQVVQEISPQVINTQVLSAQTQEVQQALIQSATIQNAVVETQDVRSQTGVSQSSPLTQPRQAPIKVVITDNKESLADVVIRSAVETTTEKATSAALDEGIPLIRRSVADLIDSRFPRVLQQVTGTSGYVDAIRGDSVAAKGQPQSFVTDRDVRRFSSQFSYEMELAGQRFGRRAVKELSQGNFGGAIGGSFLETVGELPQSFLKAAFTGVGEFAGSKIGDMFSAEIETTLQDFKAIAEEFSGVRSTRQADNLKRSAQVATQLAREAEQANPTTEEPRKKRVVFVSGGFAGQGGKSGQGISDRAQKIVGAGEDVEFIPFENKNFEVEADGSKDPAKWFAEITQQTAALAKRGYNPDAIRLASQVVALKSQNPQAEVSMMGHSAGGLIIQEALAILEEMSFTGIDSLSFGTPNVPFVAKPTQGRHQKVIGKEDFFYSNPVLGATVGTDRDVVDAGGHESSAYLDSREFQEILRNFVLGNQARQAKTGTQPTQTQAAKEVVTFEKAYNDLVKNLASIADVSPDRVPDLRINESLPKTNAANYLPQSNVVEVSKARMDSISASMQEQVAELSQKRLNELTRDLSTIAHESFHGGQYGFSGASTSELAERGKPFVSVDALTQEESATFKKLKGGEVSQLAAASTERYREQQAERLKQMSPEARDALIGTVSTLETDASTFQAKFMQNFLSLTRSIGKDSQATVAEIFDQSLQETLKSVKKLEADIPQSTTQESSRAEPAVDLEAAKAKLESYNTTLLNELARITGQSKSGGKNAIVNRLLTQVSPQELEDSIKKLEPYILTGSRGGQKLKPIVATQADSEVLERIKTQEKAFNDLLKKANISTEKERDAILRDLANLSNQNVEWAESIGRDMLAPETRKAAGAFKGRMESAYRDIRFTNGASLSSASSSSQVREEGLGDEESLAESVAASMSGIGGRGFGFGIVAMIGGALKGIFELFKSFFSRIKALVTEALQATGLIANPDRIKQRAASAARQAQSFSVPTELQQGFRVSEGARPEGFPEASSSFSAKEAEQISFFVGGIGGGAGKEGDYIGSEFAAMFPNHHTVAVENPEFDVMPKPGDSVTNPDYLMRAAKTITGEGKEIVAQRMAARAYAYHQQFPDKPINLIGQSGGGIVARRSAEILEEMGVKDIRVATAGTPHLDTSKASGITLASPSDPLKKAAGFLMKNQVATPSVGGHTQYFDQSQAAGAARGRAKARLEGTHQYQPNPEVQKVLTDYFDRSPQAESLAESETSSPASGLLGAGMSFVVEPIKNLIAGTLGSIRKLLQSELNALLADSDSFLSKLKVQLEGFFAETLASANKAVRKNGNQFAAQVSGGFDSTIERASSLAGERSEDVRSYAELAEAAMYLGSSGGLNSLNAQQSTIVQQIDALEFSDEIKAELKNAFGILKTELAKTSVRGQGAKFVTQTESGDLSTFATPEGSFVTLGSTGTHSLSFGATHGQDYVDPTTGKRNPAYNMMFMYDGSFDRAEGLSRREKVDMYKLSQGAYQQQFETIPAGSYMTADAWQGDNAGSGRHNAYVKAGWQQSPYDDSLWHHKTEKGTPGTLSTDDFDRVFDNLEESEIDFDAMAERLNRIERAVSRLSESNPQIAARLSSLNPFSSGDAEESLAEAELPATPDTDIAAIQELLSQVAQMAELELDPNAAEELQRIFNEAQKLAQVAIERETGGSSGGVAPEVSLPDLDPNSLQAQILNLRESLFDLFIEAQRMARNTAEVLANKAGETAGQHFGSPEEMQVFVAEKAQQVRGVAGQVAEGAGNVAGQAYGHYQNAQNAAQIAGEELEALEAKGRKTIDEIVNALNSMPLTGKGEEIVGGFITEIEELKEQYLTAQGIFNQIAQTNFGKSIAASFGSASAVISQVAQGFVFFKFVLMPIIGLIRTYGGEMMNAALEMERFNTVISFASGSTSAASGNIALLRSEVGRLSVDLRTAQSGYAGLLASSKDTSLEGTATNQVFSAVTQASAVYQLDPEKTERTFMALQQIMSKGSVQAEELRGQLGESLPGAFQIAARAMGVTTGELSKLLETGQVTSEEFIPRFAQQLSAETASGVAGASKSATASINRFNNALYEMQATLGKPLLGAKKLGLDIVAPLMNLVAQNADFLAEVLIFLAGSAVVTSVQGIMALGKALMTIPVVAGLVKAALTFLAKTVLPMLIGALKTLAMNFLVFHAAVSVIQMFGKALDNSGGKTKEFATSAKDGLNAYLEMVGKSTQGTERLGGVLSRALKQVNGATIGRFAGGMLGGGLGSVIGGKLGKMLENPIGSAFQKLDVSTGGVVSSMGKAASSAISGAVDSLDKVLNGIGEFLSNQKSPSLAEETIVGKLANLVAGDAGTQLVRAGERGIQGFLGQDNIVGTVARTATLGLLGNGTTYAEKQANDVSVNIGEELVATNQLLSEAYSQFNVNTGEAAGDLKELMDIERELQQVMAQRRALDPTDDAGKRRLGAQEEALLERRAQPAERVGAIQAEITKFLEREEARADEIEKQLAQLGNTPGEQEAKERLQAQYDQVKQAISEAEKMQDRFNSSIDLGADTATRLKREFLNIRAGLEQAKYAADMLASQGQQEVAQNQLAGGLNDGLAQMQTYQNGQEELNARINANIKAMSEFQNLLASPEISRAMSTAGLDFRVNTPDQIRERAQQVGGRDQPILEEAAGNFEQLRQAALETEGLRANMLQAQVDAQQQLRQTSEQVADFYRGIERSAQDAQNSIKQSDLDAVATSAKARLTRSLSKFGDTFFDEFVGGLADLLDQMFEPLRIQLQQMQQTAAINNQLADTALQGNRMLQNMAPQAGDSLTGAVIQNATGRTTRFEGVQVTSAVDASGEPGLDYVVANGRRGAEFGAVASGEVIRTVTDQNWENNMGRGGANTGRRGYGNLVVVRARDEVTGQFVDMLYAHLDRVAVEVGQQVGVGTVLGTQGRTGSTTGPHVSLDFFAPGSRGTNSAALNMRNRTARELARGAPNFNQQIQAPATTPRPQPAPQAQQAARPATPAAAPQPSRRYVPRGGTISQAERVRSDPDGARAIALAAQQLQLPADQFAALMSWESGGSMNPNIMGGDGNQYQGLIQFSPENQERYNIRPNMTIAEYMPAVVQYMRDRGFRPGEMDIRGAYSAVLAGNADQRYWNRRDSNGTSVNNAASKFQGGDHYNRAMQFLRDSGVDPRNLGSVSAPGQTQYPGMPGVNPGFQMGSGQVNQGMALAGQTASDQLAAAERLAAAQQDQASANLARSLAQQRQSFERSLRDIDDQITGQRQQQEQASFALLGDSPLAQRMQRDLSQEQEFTNENRDLLRNIRTSEQSIEMFDAAIPEIQATIETNRALGVPEATLQQFEQLIEDIKETRDGTEARLAEFRSLLEGQQVNFDLREESEQEALDLERRQNREGRLRQSANLMLQNQMNEASMSGNEIGASVIQNRIDIAGIGDRYAEQIAPFEQQLQEIATWQEKLNAAGTSLSPESLEEVQAEIAYLNEQIDDLTRHRDIEVEMTLSGLDRIREQLNDTLQQDFTESAATYMEARNDTFGAQALREEFAVGQENERYTNQVAGIEALRGSTQFTNQELDALLEKASQVNELNLENIDAQFKDLGETLADIGKNSLGTFFNDILTGSKSAGEAFKDLISNILSQVAQLAVNALMKDIFGGGGGLGGLFGGGQQQAGGGGLGSVLGGLFGSGQSIAAPAASGGGGGMGGTLGTIFQLGSMFIGGMKDGGEVSPLDHDAYRSGYGAISEALKREGSNSVLSALTPGETVLTVEQSRKYKQMGGEEIFNFKKGGTVPGGRSVPKAPSGSGDDRKGGDINVPINLAINDGGSADDRDIPAFKQVMEAQIQEVILRESRPGGTLHRRS